MKDQDELKKEIEVLRRELEELLKTKTALDKDVQKKSQQIDILVYQYMKTINQKK